MRRTALLFLVAAMLVGLVPTTHAQGNTTSNSTTNATTTSGVTNGTADNGTANNTTTTPAAPAGPLDVNLEGHGDNGVFYWEIAGQTSHNPLIQVEPGQQVTFHVTTVSGAAHNLKICANEAADACLSDSAIKPSAVISEGNELDVTWTAPDKDGFATYICTIHGTTMSGRIQVGKAASPSTTGGGDFTGSIAGDTVNLGDVYTGGDLPDACKTMKIPAIVTKSTSSKPITGGPTVSDYAKWCIVGGNPPRPASGADYVIPVSFAVIGIGVLGIVWVHRYYRP